MISYPSAPDPADFGILVGVLTGSPPSVAHALHAALDLGCYAAGQFAADNAATALPLTPTQKKAFDTFDAEVWVRSMAASPGSQHASATKINWGNVLAFIVKILSLLGPLIVNPAPATP